jgi:gas vesicle protein
MNWTDAETLIDIVDHIWIGLVGIVIAAVPSYFAHRNGKKIREIKEQVVNGHTDPLRFDLDKVITTLDKLTEKSDQLGHKVDILTSNVETLAVNVSDERVERRNQIRELREDVDSRLRFRLPLNGTDGH